MNPNRIGARQRWMLEVELRRAAGHRAVAAMAVLMLVTTMGIATVLSRDDNDALGLHTESYELQLPSVAGDEARREDVAVAPATGTHEAPDLVVQYRTYG